MSDGERSRELRARQRGGPDRGEDSAVRVAAAVVWQHGRLLVTQRPPGGPLGLLWELPGGKIESGETPESALIREIGEELGVGVEPVRLLAMHRHVYPHGLQVEIVFVECRMESRLFRTSPAVHATRWVWPEELELGEVLAGDREFLRRLGAGRKETDGPTRGT